MNSRSSRRRLARSLNCDAGYGLALLAGLLMLLLPMAGGDALRLLWQYEREALGQGQWWRLLSAHLVHLDLRHALLNAAGLLLLWALFARSYRPWQWLAALLLCVAVINAGFWWFSPWLSWYVGASALLHGVFACGCVAMLRQRDPYGYVAAAVFAAKLGWELWQGPLPTMGGQPVVTISHVYGAIGGVLAGLLLRGRTGPVY